MRIIQLRYMLPSKTAFLALKFPINAGNYANKIQLFLKYTMHKFSEELNTVSLVFIWLN